MLTLGAYLSRHFFSETYTPGDAVWYAQAEQLDPIFAVDGTDPEELRTAVDALLKQRDTMAQSYTSNERDELEASLYPARFLTLLPQLQTARDMLIDSPTPTNATHYHALLLQTIAAYASDAKSFTKAMKEAGNFDSTISTLAGSTTPAIMAERLSEAATLALMQSAKEEKRFSCYQHLSDSCESLDALRTSLYKQVTTAKPVPEPRSYTRAIDPMVRGIITYSYPHASEFSPLIGIESGCFLASTTYFRTYTFPSGSGTVRKAYVANDAYFYNVTLTGSTTNASVDRSVRDAGGTWEYQNVTNGYMCPDSGLFVSDINRVVSALELARSSTSTKAQALNSAQFVDLSDAGAFVASMGQDAAAARYMEGSSQFDENLRALINDNSFVLKSEHEGASIEYYYMYVVRSYTSIVFLLGNPSFVPGKPSLIATAAQQPANVLLNSWRYDLSKRLSTSTIESAAKETVDIIRSL